MSDTIDLKRGGIFSHIPPSATAPHVTPLLELLLTMMTLKHESEIKQQWLHDELGDLVGADYVTHLYGGWYVINGTGLTILDHLGFLVRVPRS